MSTSPLSAATDLVDVAVIGGSAAGLAGALQLARQLRSVIVYDDATPRNAPAAHLHGYLGFDGRPPAELVAAGQHEVASYGVELIHGHVTEVQGDRSNGFTLIDSRGGQRAARRVLVATGLTDELPDIDGLEDQWGNGVIHCPFCHGYEHRGERHVHLATLPAGLHPAALFAHLAGHLTVVITPDIEVDPAAVDALRLAEVTIVTAHVAQVVSDGGRVRRVELLDGRAIEADVVSVTPRVRARAEVLEPIGLVSEPHPMGIGDHVTTDATGQTSVEGIYAAGNVSDPSHQLLQAAADGARVGAMIAFDLAAAS